MARFTDLTGRRFTRLTVLERTRRDRKKVYWLCRCDCGLTTVATTPNLNGGYSRSCGCLKREMAAARAKIQHRTHGLTKIHPLWSIWCGLRTRCNNPNATGFERWGGKGIKVCERWDDFTNFIADVGDRPSLKHSLDRIDGNGDYEPGNVRWATREEQANNRRDNHVVTYRGTEMSVRKAWRISGRIVDIHTVTRRLAKGWPVAKAVETPSLKK